MPQPKLYSQCAVKGCESKYYKGQYCPKHRSRLRRTGTLEQRLSQAEWLADAVAAAMPDKCVVWPFATRSRGYGAIEFEGESTYAHRAALQIFTGSNPPNLLALHGPCHNPSCVNPHHLSWGTQSQNMLDKRRDGTTHGRRKRSNKTGEQSCQTQQ